MTMSGTNALLNVFNTLVDPGKNVLLPEPYFPLYGPDVRLVGGEARFYPCLFENEFVPTVESLEALVDENTVAILYNFPSNPTGATINIEQRDELLAFAQRHDLWLITDPDRVILINSFSKTYAMTGWRIGYIMCANQEAINQFIKIQYYITACSNDAMQYAVLTVFDEASDYPDIMAQEFKARCDLIVTRLNAMPGVQCHKPKGAFYVFPKVEVPGMNSEEIAIELLKGGVLCSPGTAFGASGEGHLRFAYTISREDISRGMDKTETVLRALRGE
jgi:aspartate/methionine/tyrosine aminotransferase